MTYGSYEFSPVPLVSIVKEYISTDGGVKIGARFNMTLDGTLTPIPDTAGISNTMPLTEDLRDGLAQDGCPFVIACDDNVLWSGHPIVNSINFEQSNNNWVQSIPYSVELVFDMEDNQEDFSSAPFIDSVSEEWGLEFSEDQSYHSWELDTGTDSGPYILSMTHSVEVKGRPHYSGCDDVTTALSAAKSYAGNLLSTGRDAAASGQLDGSNLGLVSSSFEAYNHTRKEVSNAYAGTYAVTENWLVLGSGVASTGIPGNALEDFTVRVEKTKESDLASISVEGTIQGVEVVNYTSPMSVTTSKYDNASDYWSNVQNRLYYRCKKVHEDEYDSVRTLNIDAANESISHNPPKGVISYSYTYDDRPSNCITGALSEVITITDNNPTDVFAKIVVLGRALGPVLQDINTITEATREVNIEVTTKPANACSVASLSATPNNVSTDVDSLIDDFESALTSSYAQVFKHVDTESWSPKDGRYSRNIGWTYQDCS